MLRLQSNPPNRRQVANSLFWVFYNERENAKLSVSGIRGILCIDGWSSITYSPVIGVSFVVYSGKSYFAEAIDTTCTPPTCDNLYKYAI